jgi:hypothetical protein
MLLWKGKWSDGDFLRHRWPHLFSFEKDKNVKVERENGSVELSELFYLPLSVKALAKFHYLHILLQSSQP